MIPERAFGKGSELVEERGNDHRVDSHHEEGNKQDEEPEVQCNQGPCVLQNQGDGGYYRGQENQSKSHLQHMQSGHLKETSLATSTTWHAC